MSNAFTETLSLEYMALAVAAAIAELLSIEYIALSFEDIALSFEYIALAIIAEQTVGI